MSVFKRLIFSLLLTVQSAAYANNLLSQWDVEFGLEFPMHFGLHTKVSRHENIYTRLGVGIVHSVMLKTPLASTLMNMTSSLDEENEMPLVIDTLADSFYLNLSFGYRQSSRSGLYGEIGYSNIFRLEPKGVAVDVLQKALSREELEAKEVNYHVKAISHNLTLHAGYTFPLSKHVSFSAELGAIKPLYVQATVDYKDLKQADSFEKEDGKKIEDLVGSLWMLTSGLWVSVTF